MSNENNTNKKRAGLADYLHFVESDVDAVNAGRIVRFGSGRLSTYVVDNSVQITSEQIRNLPNTDNETDE